MIGSKMIASGFKSGDKAYLLLDTSGGMDVDLMRERLATLPAELSGLPRFDLIVLSFNHILKHIARFDQNTIKWIDSFMLSQKAEGGTEIVPALIYASVDQAIGRQPFKNKLFIYSDTNVSESTSQLCPYTSKFDFIWLVVEDKYKLTRTDLPGIHIVLEETCHAA